MIAWLIVLPILVSVGTAATLLVAGSYLPLQRAISILGGLLHLIISAVLLHTVVNQGPLVMVLGSWSAPFGIVMVADVFSALMVLISSLISLVVIIYSIGSLTTWKEGGAFHALFHTQIMGVCGAFLAGDIFNLYVWFEVLLVASFVLLILGRSKAQIRGAIQYAVINIVSSMCFLVAVALLYGATGTLNIADLAVKLPLVDTGLVTTISMLFIVAFGVKAAMFPLFFWLPSSYPAAPIGITAVFAALLTKVGVYSLIRVFTLFFTNDVPYTHGILMVMAGATMLVGAIAALSANHLQVAFSYQIICHIGYMVMGLALHSPDGTSATVFYIVHDMVVKANLFLVAGLIYRLNGSYLISQLGGVYKSAPWLAVLYLIPALSLAGTPPLSGFWSKLFIIRAGLDAGAYVMVAIALISAFLTLILVGRIWSGVFWKPDPIAENVQRHNITFRPMWLMVLPVVVLSAVTLWIGFFPEALYSLSELAAETIFNPSSYIEAVLGSDAIPNLP